MTKSKLNQCAPVLIKVNTVPWLNTQRQRHINKTSRHRFPSALWFLFVFFVVTVSMHSKLWYTELFIHKRASLKCSFWSQTASRTATTLRRLHFGRQLTFTFVNILSLFISCKDFFKVWHDISQRLLLEVLSIHVSASHPCSVQQQPIDLFYCLYDECLFVCILLSSYWHFLCYTHELNHKPDAHSLAPRHTQLHLFVFVPPSK